ncbi:winged helix-turn-helix domain-containing protein [Actinomadura litoris]|nr:winged helix-turn-helix domain-containing protein [Actinomadura litoris]
MPKRLAGHPRAKQRYSATGWGSFSRINHKALAASAAGARRSRTALTRLARTVQLSPKLLGALEQELAKGPLAHGYSDQTWTLERIKTLIGRRFHKSMTFSGIAQMLHHNGGSHQVPAAALANATPERVSGWVKETWLQVEAPCRRIGHRSSSKTRPGSRATPPTRRTWSRSGHTPLVTVRGRSQRRISIAALACYRPG